MNQTKNSQNSALISQQEVYLYQHGVTYDGWLIVPVIWDENSYTTLCLDPHGIQYLQWKNCSSLAAAINAGEDLVNKIIQHSLGF